MIRLLNLLVQHTVSYSDQPVALEGQSIGASPFADVSLLPFEILRNPLGRIFQLKLFIRIFLTLCMSFFNISEIPELRDYLRMIYLKEKQKLVKDYVTEIWAIHRLAKNFGSSPQPEV